MSIRMLAPISERDERRHVFDEDDDCPDYEAVVSRSNSGASTPYSRSSYNDQTITPLNIPRRSVRPLPRHERYVYTYRLMAGATPLQFMISVEPESGKPMAGKCKFCLSLKVNGIERSLCEPAMRTLKVDPRHLEFVVFIFPGKAGVPVGCLWSLRGWLRVGGVDHRLFGEDELWVGKDPDFNSMGDASFARLKATDSGDQEYQVYHGYVGRALVAFIVRWECISNKLYKYSLEYEASGVGDMLFDDVKLKLDGDPRAVTFCIFTIPSNSIPSGASHKLRVWIRSLVPLSSAPPTASYGLPFNDSYIYQRIWKCDAFKIGSRLDFASLGNRMIMAFSSGIPETIVMPNPVPSAADLHSPASMYKEKRGGYDF